MDVLVLDTGGHPIPEVGGAIPVHCTDVECTFFSSRFSRLLHKKKRSIMIYLVNQDDDLPFLTLEDTEMPS